MLFFCLSFKGFVAERFAQDDSEDGSDGGEGKGHGDSESAEGGEDAIDPRERNYRWFSQIDEVSHTKGVSWDDVMSMGIIEFFNIVSYCKERNRRQREEMMNWKYNNIRTY